MKKYLKFVLIIALVAVYATILSGCTMCFYPEYCL